MNDHLLAWRAEEACRRAWPSPREIVLDHWLIRYAGGATRRTNSVNPLSAKVADPIGVIERARALYHAQGQATIFRVLSIVPDMEAPLDRLGFVADGHSCTLFLERHDFLRVELGQTELMAEPSREWLEAKNRMTPLSQGDRLIYEQMHGLIGSPKAFAATRSEGRIVAVAYGVIHDGLLVLESVVTDPAERGRGFGVQTVGSLMAWAARNGADAACLQVVVDNTPARALYHKLGFRTEISQYHYRREPR
jgi:ribosomal protein S18 acetylase RimI-like enzyme